MSFDPSRAFLRLDRRRLALVAGALVAVALFPACMQETPAQSPTNELDVLKARAQVDLKCEPSGIHSKTIDDRTHVAWGCGRTATYVESCDKCGQEGYVTGGRFGVGHLSTSAKGCECTFLLNSAVTAE